MRTTLESTPKDRQERLRLSYLVTIGCSMASRRNITPSQLQLYPPTEEHRGVGKEAARQQASRPGASAEQAKQANKPHQPPSPPCIMPSYSLNPAAQQNPISLTPPNSAPPQSPPPPPHTPSSALHPRSAPPPPPQDRKPNTRQAPNCSRSQRPRNRSPVATLTAELGSTPRKRAAEALCSRSRTPMPAKDLATRWESVLVRTRALEARRAEAFQKNTRAAMGRGG